MQHNTKNDICLSLSDFGSDFYVSKFQISDVNNPESKICKFHIGKCLGID